TEVILPRLKTDLLEIFEAIKTNQLNTIKIEFEDKKAATVVLVSKGYPEAYNNAKNIEIDTIENSIVFHAGTKYIDEELVTNGGRVFVITSLAENIKLALDSSYKNIENINFEGKRYRKDIGFDLE
ncbi:MAG: phosphoribosylamine--glycine ligase, partial [Bacteroidales bacterium]|nr:phosphoribosylamine--glycine ligase [Bacteroidales bacterium]